MTEKGKRSKRKPAESRDASPAPSPPVGGGRSKAVRNIDGGSYVTMPRAALKQAPYNPRMMDPYAAKGLQESIKRTGGLVQPPIWNKRTGNLVAGHQRITQSDKLYGGTEYELTVCVVDLTPTEERQLNVAMNSQVISGRFDIDALDALIRETPDFSIADAGFDAMSLADEYLAAGAEIPDFLMPADPLVQHEVTRMAEDAAALMDEADATKLLEGARADAEAVQVFKDKKRAFAERQGFRSRAGYHVTVIFPDDASKRLFNEQCGQEPDAEMVDGFQIAEALSLPMSKRPG